jgi:hypothetical protein
MTPPMETVYLSSRRTYEISCSDCGARREVHASKVPHTREPYRHQCACGTVSLVRLVSFRCAPRKDVHLPAVLVRKTRNSSIRIPVVVENLSVKGLRVKAEPTRQFNDQEVKILMVVPGKARTVLDVPCKVRRVLATQPELRLALEFQGLNPEEEHALAEYLTTT